MRQRGSATITMQSLLRLVSGLCLVALSTLSCAEARFSLARTPGKLPKNVVPDLTQFTFSGEEAIDLEVRVATRSTVLNANHLDIDSATLALAYRGTINAV